MSVLRLALVTSVIMAGLMGSASSHSKPKHSHGAAHAHSSGHRTAHPHHTYEGSTHHGHGTHHERHGAYRKPAPPPAPGRQQDGRYVLPGGLESVCAGGTPPPCVNGQ
jgi:hypothetical protein